MMSLLPPSHALRSRSRLSREQRMVDAHNPEDAQIERIEATCEALCSAGQHDELIQVLADLPPGVIAQHPRLLYYRGWGHLHTDDWHKAAVYLRMAADAATRHADWSLAIKSYLTLARVYQRREIIDLAHEYLRAAENLVKKHPPTTPQEEGEVALGIGRLLPDLADNEQAVKRCTAALRCFEEAGAVRQQTEALWLLAVAQCYLGKLREARTNVARALSLNSTYNLGELQRLYLLNVRAQIHLHAGNLEYGLATVEAAASLRSKHPVSKPALYLHMTEAGLQRTAGDVQAAHAAYARAEGVLNSLGDDNFRPWLEMEWGWARVLSGTPPAKVRSRIIAIIDPQNKATRRTVETILGLLDTLEGRYTNALARLTHALPDFESAGELLSALAVRTYQAYVRWRMGDHGAARSTLEASMGRARRLGVDGFHLFWHPGIVADLYAEAIRWGVHTTQAELTFIRRLRDAGIPALVGLLDESHERARLEATSILRTLGATEVLSALDAEPSAATRSALLSHLRAQRLPLKQLMKLEQRLRTAEHHDRRNWNRVAIFGYYVTGQFTREQIAHRVQLAEPTVRNYITEIRRAFDTSDLNELRRQAKEAGLIN